MSLILKLLIMFIKYLTLSPFSTMTCFHIRSAYYLGFLYNFRKLVWGLK
ncbi:hypothetical protein E2C01_018598 [Portunus trituberculatus]|uniref:Uncharacterized protein n=1 Tax=Portunus trituberculatus TaxID=210409 RepID=A0A5B7DUV9_PORTR|nr:hypothetical protein [Portunus trituberculatus]